MNELFYLKSRAYLIEVIKMNKRNTSKNVYNNSKYNRYKQPRTPSPSTSSSDDASTSTSQKFTIEHKASTKKLGSNNNKHSNTIDSNKEIVIPRRFGFKPIFNRQDVQVNSYSNRRSVSVSPPPKSNERSRKSSSSSCSSSPERYRSTKNKRRKISISPIRKKTPDKVPYFVDTKRELDRLRTKVEVSHSKSDNKHIPTTSSETGRKTYRSKSRSRSYERKRRRSSSREKYRRSRSHSRHRHNSSQSRSHSRDRYYRNRVQPPVETQYIPIPVPMEYTPFAPQWMHPMMPYTFPRYPPFGNVMRPPFPPHFPRLPYFPPRIRGRGQQFQRPQRGKHYLTRNQ